MSRLVEGAVLLSAIVAGLSGCEPTPAVLSELEEDEVVVGAVRSVGGLQCREKTR
ncbi:MAG: hypothetical protein GDA36_06080 [Rhodobacteraceae bacterium]|nr:hypothetical protein [Paracoccaceae bacterium]